MSLVPKAVLFGIGLISVDAQLLTPSKGKSVTFGPGSPPSRLVLAITAPPAPGDRMEIRSSSQKIEMAIVTPDGGRIDAKEDPAFFEIALTVPVEKLTLTLTGGKVISAGPGGPASLLR
jgi:hypothetical protein